MNTSIAVPTISKLHRVWKIVVMEVTGLKFRSGHFDYKSHFDFTK